jgi:hypothetical protein
VRCVQVRESLHQRAGDFGIVLEDVAITHLSFSSEVRSLWLMLGRIWLLRLSLIWSSSSCGIAGSGISPYTDVLNDHGHPV